MRHMFTSLMTTNKKSPTIYQDYLDYVRERRLPETFPTSPININDLSKNLKGRVAGILRPKYTSSIITTTITSLMVIENIMNTIIIINRKTKKSTMVTQVMGGRVDVMDLYPPLKNSFYMITGGVLTLILIPISESYIINTYIIPLFTTITSYILSIIIIIANHTHLLINMTTIF